MENKKNILRAYLMPHPPIIIEQIGRGEENKAKATIEGMKEISKDIESIKPSTIVLITPHGPLFSDAIAISGESQLRGSFKKFGHGELAYSFKNNLDLVNKILEKSSKENIVTIRIDEDSADLYNIENELDHGSLVPLHFISEEYKTFKLVHITYGILSPKDLYRFGKIIKDSLIEIDEEAVIIASGDLSHKLSDDGPYGYSPSGEIFDKKIIEIIKNKDLKKLLSFDLSLGEKAGECGLRSLMMMAGTLDGYSIDTKILSYQGPFGVGYATAIIDLVGENSRDVLKDVESQENLKMKEIRENESSYVKLARESLEHFIKTGNILDVKDESDVKKGVFVTLKKDGMLRGCIGTTEATKSSIEREIVQNALSAGTKDPRFKRVEEEELEKLMYSVDVLSQAEDINSIEDLDVEEYGIIVSSGFKRGLLLPNIDGVDSVEEQIKIALEKAGIKQGENYKIKRFKVIRHH